MFDRGLPVWISREIGFRLVGQKGGFSQAVDAAFAVKKASEFASAETLRSVQLDKLVALLKHAQAHCPYYTDLFRAHRFDPAAVRSVADLAALPVLEKTDLIAHRERMVSDRHDRTQLNLNSTGGSTGVTVNFYQDRNWLAHQVAGGVAVRVGAVGAGLQLQPRDGAEQLPRLGADALAVGEVAGVVVGGDHRERVPGRDSMDPGTFPSA